MTQAYHKTGSYAGRIMVWCLVAMIRCYRYGLSWLLGRQCRYAPSCSDYTEQAIRRHGAWAGGWLGLGRLARCHPWGGMGFDPVPERLPAQAKWYAPWQYISDRDDQIRR